MKKIEADKNNMADNNEPRFSDSLLLVGCVFAMLLVVGGTMVRCVAVPLFRLPCS